MTRMRGNHYWMLVGVGGLVTLADQVTKAAVLASMGLYETIPVIPGFFNLTYIQNPGGAFGFLAGADPFLRRWLFVAFTVLAMGVIVWLYRQAAGQSPVLALGLALIFGGALGNLIDRLRYGQVVDFLDVYINNLHWPAFNIADSAVTVGTIIFAYFVLFKRLDI